MGNGQNLVSFCHVDNYAHGLILGHAALYENSPCLGKFYLITDGPPQRFWHVIDSAVKRFGGTSLYDKWSVPLWILYPIAYLLQGLGYIFGTNFRINPFNVTMLTIDRYFNIVDAERDLKYTPVKTFEKGWEETLKWFEQNKAWALQQAAASVR
jgi:nucleoside-diphosphate-sugar epimerase